MVVNNLQSQSKTKEYIIGGAKYIVTSIFSENAKETVEQKLIKYISERVVEDYRMAMKAIIVE
jgi:dTDP-D-glucose 4,6-dehydratase